MDLYSILEINNNASPEEIRKAYKKLALKYHPDKNKNGVQQFQSISMAYNILIDIEQRKKYDQMNPQKKKTIFDIIINIYQSCNLPQDFKENIEKYIIQDNDYKKILLTGNPELIKEFIYNKLNNYILNIIYDKMNSYDDDLTSIFISEQINKKEYNILVDNLSIETSRTSTTINDNLLELSIITDLNEIYMDKLKEISVQRQRLKDKIIIIDEKKFYIHLADDKLVLEKEGDDYIDTNGIMQRGDIIIKTRCKKHKFLKRVNDYDILLILPITLYDIIKGFEKTFKYLGNDDIKIKSSNPLSEYKFDGDKLTIIINNKGLPYIDNNESKRGNLIIFLMLKKDKDFYSKLKKHFN